MRIAGLAQGMLLPTMEVSTFVRTPKTNAHCNPAEVCKHETGKHSCRQDAIYHVRSFS